MAIKKISEFVSGTPASDSKILFEQNEKGKSCTIGDAVNTCALTYEEIMATDPVSGLSGKVASASALKYLAPRVDGKIIHFTSSRTLSYIQGAYVTIPANCIFGISAKLQYNKTMPVAVMISEDSSGDYPDVYSYSEVTANNGMLGCSFSSYTIEETNYYVWGKYNAPGDNEAFIRFWYIQL